METLVAVISPPNDPLNTRAVSVKGDQVAITGLTEPRPGKLDMKLRKSVRGRSRSVNNNYADNFEKFAKVG